jgi:hypothetical protein
LRRQRGAAILTAVLPTHLQGRNEMQTYPVKLASLLKLGQPDPAHA